MEKGLIPYKFVQYLNVVYKKTQHGEYYDNKLEKDGEEYSCDQFYEKSVNEFFNIDISGGAVSGNDFEKLSDFHNNIVAIIGSDDYEILGDFPDSVKRNSNWETIRTAYGLKEVKTQAEASAGQTL